MSSNQPEFLSACTSTESDNLSPEEVRHLEWSFIHRTLVECQRRLQADGARHSWIDPAIDIAAARKESPRSPPLPRRNEP